MRKLRKVTFVTIGISIFYIALAIVLSVTDTELSMRTWADVLGQMIAAVVVPLLIIVMLVLWGYKRERLHLIVKGIFALVAGVGYLFWAYWAVIIILFGMQEEWKIAPNLIITNEAVFLQESSYAYYRPVGLFFKIPAELTNEVKIEYLKKKYGREFVTDESESGYICDQELPDVKISVYLSNRQLDDDYVKQTTLKYLAEGYKVLNIKYGYHIAKDYRGKDNLLYIEFDGENEIGALSKDIAKMIDYCMEHTDLFEKYYGNIGLSSLKGNHEITILLPFGKQTGWEKEDDYYCYPDRIAEVIAEKYVYYADRYAQMDEQAQQSIEEETKIHEETCSAELPKDSVEENAKALYDAVLADEGFSYNVCYNAKGNFYVDLGEKDGYHYSLVYDHPSKNGACELYVLYKFTGNDGSDIIVDMYAVENATKRVVASGRKRWSDVGTKEYREITEQEILSSETP